jgi:putative heme-binding domain-containing protein
MTSLRWCLPLLLATALAGGDDDTSANIPEAWKAAPRVSSEGWGWYFATVRPPEAWGKQDWTFLIESVDDAREIYLDGKLIGRVGTMPPQFRSGLGETAQLTVRPADRRAAADHVIAIRVYYRDGRTGFNVAAPVIVAGEEAIRLSGEWRSRAGDDAAWAGLAADALKLSAFDKTEPAAEVLASLKKVANDEGPLSPQESLKHLSTPSNLRLDLALADPDIAQPLSIKWDERGRLWLVEFRQYPNPAGLKAVSRDKFLRTVYDKLPAPPPHHFPGADRITIHSDADGDGYYESHKIFLEGLSLVSSIAFDADGLWVLNPPYLLFYPDKNHDDQPDGDPEVHLEGFGIEDSHSIANNLRWGPDGWLYGAQGSTVSGNIRRPGEKKVVHSQGQLIWRYHPRTKQYEVFAEGGGNTFGVEIDSAGRIFSGHNGGDTRGFHYVQGGYSQKGFGKHGALSNPFAFGYFAPMKHPSVPRFTHCFVINDDPTLGEAYVGRMFAAAPLQGQVVISRLERDGSTFQTRDEGFAITSTDSWFRPVDIQQGPDGALYVADMYEQRIDHASHYQGRVHTTSGRIYRLAAADAKPAKLPTLADATPDQLLHTLATGNRWQRQTAQRLLAQRGAAAVQEQLPADFSKAEGQAAVELLWELHRAGQLTEPAIVAALGRKEPAVRRWTVQLACNDGKVSLDLAKRLADLAARETDAEVRSQLAASARRLPPGASLPIVERLLQHSEDTADPHIPLLLWWAIETHCEKHRDAVLELFRSEALWREPLVREAIVERLMKRFAQSGARHDLATCAKLLELAPTADDAKRLIAGLESSVDARALAAAPPELNAAIARHGGGSLLFRVRQGEQAAIDEALRLLADDKQEIAKRTALIAALPARSNAAVVATLLKLANESTSDEIRGSAMTALSAVDKPEVGEQLVALHAKVPEELRLVIQNLAASRPTWARSLLADIAAGKIAKDQVSPVVVRKLRLFPQDDIVKVVEGLWGTDAAVNPAQLAERLQQLEGTLSAAVGNPYPGHKLFREQCARCHTLFGEGGKIGPDLTAYKRDDLRGMLMHVLSPSLEIREGFETFMLSTSDGRQLTGFIADQDAAVVVVRGVDGKNVVVPRTEIEEMEASRMSLMPEGLLSGMQDQQVRDLFAYLRSTQPLAD